MPPELPVRRSKLVFSSLGRDAVHAALSSEADALVVDLAPSEGSPESARDAAARLLAEVATQPLDLMLLLGDDPAADLRACLSSAVTGVTVRARSEEDVALVSRLLDQAEAKRGDGRRTGIDVALASCDAVLDCLQVAKAASGRITSLSLWDEALLREMVMPEPREVDLLFYPRGRLVIASRLLGVEAHALAFIPWENGAAPDPEARARRSRNLGSHGAFCRTPDEAAALNRGFTAPEPEVRDARGMKDAMDEGIRQGLGAVSYNGMMIDIAMYKQCRAIVERADAIARRESVKAGRPR